MLLGLIGVVVEGLDVLLGVDCDPVTILGSGSDCNSNVVCCEDNNVVSVLRLVYFLYVSMLSDSQRASSSASAAFRLSLRDRCSDLFEL